MIYFCIMDDPGKNITEPAARKFRFSLLQVKGIVALVVIIAALLTAWWVKYYIYACKFTPTILTVKEQRVLDSYCHAREKGAGRQVMTLLSEWVFIGNSCIHHRRTGGEPKSA